MEKVKRNVCRKSFKDSKAVFVFYSSMKTEAVLFFYIHIFEYIYKKLSPKWKKFQEQKVFFCRFYTLCENFIKIGPIIKKIPKFPSDPLKVQRSVSLLVCYAVIDTILDSFVPTSQRYRHQY